MLDELHVASAFRGGRTGRWTTLAAELRDWVARARAVIPREDREILLNPPRLVARFARYALRRTAGNAGHATADDVRARDPELVYLLGELIRILADHYFRLRLEGVEHVPRFNRRLHRRGG